MENGFEHASAMFERMFSPRRKIKRIFIIAVAAGIFAGAALCSFLWQQYSWAFPFSDSGPETPGVLPADTEILLLFKPDLNQVLNFNRFKETCMSVPQIRESVEDWQRTMEEELEIDFESDVLPWIGPEMSVALWDLGEMLTDPTLLYGINNGSSPVPPMVLVATVRDEEACWLELSESDGSADFRHETYLDVDLLVSESSVVTVTDGFMVAGSTKAAVCAVIDLIKGGAGTSLADSEDYQRVMAELPKSKAGVLYISSAFFDGLNEALNRAIDEESPTAETDLSLYKDLYKDLYKGCGAALVFVPEGVKLHIVSAADKAKMESLYGQEHLAEICNMQKHVAAFNKLTAPMPKGTALYAGGYGGDPQIVFDNMLRLNPAAAETFGLMEEETGIDLETDVFSWMDGSGAFALLPGSSGLDGLPFGFLLAVGTKDQQATQNAIDHLLAGTLGEKIPLSQSLINGHTLYTLSPVAPISYTFYSNLLIVGSSEQLLSEVLSQPYGMTRSSRFRGAVSLLPTDEVCQFFVDGEGLRQLVSGFFADLGDQTSYTQEVLPYLKLVKSVSMSGKTELTDQYYLGSGTLFVALNQVRYIEVRVNGTPLNLEFAPFIENGRTLVPFRAVADALGAEVNWDGATRTVTLTKGDKTVQLRIGDGTAYINGQPVKLDQPARISRSRTVVPLRFVGESLDAAVRWDPVTSTVHITTGG